MSVDKFFHFMVGFVIQDTGSMFVGEANSFWLSVGVGAAKELIYDKAMGLGTVEFMDFVATALGALVAYFTSVS